MSWGFATPPGPPYMVGPMRDEDREAINRRAKELAAEAPDLDPDRLARLRMITNPPRTPRPGRGGSTRAPFFGEPQSPEDGPR